MAEDEFHLKPDTVVLKDQRTRATLHPITNADSVPEGLLQFLCEEFNAEIRRGDTYPQMDPMEVDAFKTFWFGSFGAVFIIGEQDELPQSMQWEEKVLGSFYIKPNYPGRCSHICNAGFLVNEYIRGKGVGRKMGEMYLKWGPKLGYTYSMFNLVFETNIASIKIWDSLGFERVANVKGAGKLKGHHRPVNAFVYGRQFDLEQ